MTVRAAIRFLLAGSLGAACALLVACGSSGSKGLIPPTNAGPLSNDFDAVAQAVNAGDCTATREALARAQRDFDQLGSTVDAGLKAEISKGLDNLRSIAPGACAQAQSSSTTQSTTTTTTTTTPSTSTTTSTPSTSTTTSTPSTSTTPSTPTTGTTTQSTTGGTAGGTPAPSGNGSGGATPGGNGQ